MTTATALYQTEFGPYADKLKVGEITVDASTADNVLIKVRAAALNPVDLFRVSGLGSDPVPAVVGYDVAGRVVALGPSCTSGLAVGDAVYGDIVEESMGVKTSGSVAEYCLAKETLLAKKPEALTWEEAAGAPVALQTAYQGLKTLGIKSGDKLLVTGGAGGVGIHVIQLAKCSLFGAAEVTTTTSQAKSQLCKQYGADKVVDYRAAPFDEQIPVGTFDAVYDTTGEFERASKLLKEGSTDRLVSIHSKAFSPGVTVKAFSVTPTNSDLEAMAPVLSNNEVKIVIDKVFPLSDAMKAMDLQASGHAAGKLVVSVTSG